MVFESTFTLITTRHPGTSLCHYHEDTRECMMRDTQQTHMHAPVTQRVPAASSSGLEAFSNHKELFRRKCNQMKRTRQAGIPGHTGAGADIPGHTGRGAAGIPGHTGRLTSLDTGGVLTSRTHRGADIPGYMGPCLYLLVQFPFQTPREYPSFAPLSQWAGGILHPTPTSSNAWRHLS